MAQILELRNQKVLYKIKRSKRAKYMRLSVAQDASVMLTIPWKLNVGQGINFLESKIQWIVQKLAYFKGFNKIATQKFGARQYALYKDKALQLAIDKIKYWNQFYGFVYNRVNIKNQKTRWGSCSRKGNLNFNVKIVNLPEELLDYLAVHELCHLKEFNHSKRFWWLVAKTFPNYRQLRINLKKNL